MIIRPQQGFQENALSTPADIAILGGSAGAGKTFTLLMEPTRHLKTKGFTGTIFRRTMPQIKNPGGLWDTSQKLYNYCKGTPRESKSDWVFPSGARMQFAHMEYEKNKLDWQGSQIAFIGFDELTHFTETMFFYMVSRNRSDCGVRPYIRATCNPDPDSWVAKFIDWWIDPETGFPIRERAGKLRYFTRDGETIVWGDSPAEVAMLCPHIFNNPELLASGVQIKDLIKSVTFIPGSIYDNKLFIQEDPAYLGNLLSLPEEEKSQLLDGNWKIRTDGLGLCDFRAVNAIFDNYPESDPNPLRAITCDAARFGRDLCTIKVWKGWEVIHTVIYKKSDVHDIVNKIEELRRKFSVMKHNVIIDQDGVGGGSVKLGQYRGFSGGSPVMKDPGTRIKENYFNLKTQCYYRLAEKINNGQLRYSISNENCQIYDASTLTGYFTTKIKLGSEVKDVRDLIKADLRAIKRAKVDMDGKIHMNPKEEQKNILGRSPDFGDNLMMRAFLDLKQPLKNMVQR